MLAMVGLEIKMILLKRVSFGSKNCPEEQREYQVLGKGPVGTLEEFERAYPLATFVIEGQ